MRTLSAIVKMHFRQEIRKCAFQYLKINLPNTGKIRWFILLNLAHSAKLIFIWDLEACFDLNFLGTGLSDKTWEL